MRRSRGVIALAAGLALCSIPIPADAGRQALRFGPAVVLQQGGGHTEPSLVIDSKGRIFVSAIAGLPGNVTAPGTPLWRSENGGRSFTVHATASVGPAPTVLAGGDSALILDKRNVVYGTDLWLGDDSVWYSTDHGDTFTGFPFSHRPADDRNWLAYSRKDDAIYQIFDGLDGLWISRADLGGPLGSSAALSFAFNQQIAPEGAVGGGSDHPYVRGGIAPPGGIAVDQRTGAVYTSWSDQHGVAIGRSADKGASWRITHIPGTRVTGDLLDTEWNFIPIATDPAGNLFAAWSQVIGHDARNPHGISMWLGASRDGGKHWTKTRLPALSTAAFPALAVYAKDRVGMAWVDTAHTGDPNGQSFLDARWRLRYAEVTGLLGGHAHVTEATADPAAHNGTLFVGPQGQSDRGMGDFFSVAVGPAGQFVIAYTRGEQFRNHTVVRVLAPHPAA
jgi:hypothetical protein